MKYDDKYYEASEKMKKKNQDYEENDGEGYQMENQLFEQIEA